MKQTIEDCAIVVWGMARDLASPSLSGTALNSERNVKYIASVIHAYARMHAETESIALEAYKVAHLNNQITDLQKQLKQVKVQLKNSKQSPSTNSH